MDKVENIIISNNNTFKIDWEYDIDYRNFPLMLCKNLLNIKEPNQYTIKGSSIASFYIVQLLYDITNKNTFKTRLKNRHRLLDGENIEPNIGRGRNHQFRDSEQWKKAY